MCSRPSPTPPTGHWPPTRALWRPPTPPPSPATTSRRPADDSATPSPATSIISHPPDSSDDHGTNPLWPGRGPQWRIHAVFVTRGQAPEWTRTRETPPLAGGNGRYEPTRATESPWDRTAQHGGPPAALLAHVIDQTVEGPFRIGRISVDILGP